MTKQPSKWTIYIVAIVLQTIASFFFNSQLLPDLLGNIWVALVIAFAGMTIVPVFSIYFLTKHKLIPFTSGRLFRTSVIVTFISTAFYVAYKVVVSVTNPLEMAAELNTTEATVGYIVGFVVTVGVVQLFFNLIEAGLATWISNLMFKAKLKEDVEMSIEDNIDSRFDDL